MGSERLHCVFNKNADACNYGVFVGLVGLMACSFFFLLDYKFSSISSVKDRKKAIMLEIGFSGEEAIVLVGRIYTHTQHTHRVEINMFSHNVQIVSQYKTFALWAFHS